MGLNAGALDQRELTDGDGYTWLALVEGWIETSRWSPVVRQHNAPYGLETHLTAPYAAVVLGLAAPLRLGLPPEDAARIAGMLSGPLLHVVTALALAWGAAAVLRPGGTLLAVLAFLMMPMAYSRFGLREFDHHALHLCLTVLTIALVLRHASATGNAGRLAGAAGVAAGIGVWSGTEMLVPAGIVVLAMGLAWVAWGGDWRVRGLWLYALGMAVALTAALAVERPATEWTSLELDRLSGSHVLMAAALVTATGALALAQRRWPDLGAGLRIAAAAVAGGGALLALWTAAPEFFLLPMWTDVPEFLLGNYRNFDAEDHGLFDGSRADRGAGLLFAAIPGLLGSYLFPFGFAAARAGWGLRPGPGRETWMVLALGMAVGAALAFWQWRLLQHYTVFASIALGAAAADLARFFRMRAPAGLRAATAGIAMLCAMLSPYLGWWATDDLPADEASHHRLGSFGNDDDCDWPSVGAALAGLARERGGTIATYAAPGPELAHFSGLGVVASGCHRNAEGMSDVRAMLLSAPESAREIAERRNVEFVLQCPASKGWLYHDWYLERAGPDGLYARLARGAPPRWLTPVSDSELGADGFVVHRTVFDGTTQPEPSGDIRE